MYTLRSVILLIAIIGCIFGTVKADFNINGFEFELASIPGILFAGIVVGTIALVRSLKR